jgi:hypothetical protein
MTKTGWPPPPLMQDDNPQLSRWFASRPDALYVLKTNQSRTEMIVITQDIMSDLQFIVADLRDYVNDPAEYRITYIEDVYTLVSRVLKDLNIEPLRKEGEQ